MQKDTIKARFNNSCHSYDDHAQVQKNSAQILTRQLYKFSKDFNPKNVLDLGCGTGCAAELLLQRYRNAHYCLSDIAPNMIKTAQNKFSRQNNFSYHIGDMEGDMEIINFNNYDLIISNLAMQWLNNLERSILKLYAKSQIFAFSCLLDGTFSEWDKILTRYDLTTIIKKYPTKTCITNFCHAIPAAKIYCASKNFRIKFSNALDFMRYLKNLGASSGSKTVAPKKLITLINEHTEEFFVTYKIFFAIIKK
jgi:malonyl-CoA O-methyltransferase